MKAKLLMDYSKRKPIIKHYPKAIQVNIWFNQPTQAKDFIGAAIRKFGIHHDIASLIEFHFSDLSRTVRLTFDKMEKQERDKFKKWLTGYAYAKGFQLPMYNLIDQPKIFNSEENNK